jgi:hypothetical protein
MLHVKRVSQILFSFWLAHKFQLSFLYSLKLEADNETYRMERARLKPERGLQETFWRIPIITSTNILT